MKSEEIEQWYKFFKRIGLKPKYDKYDNNLQQHKGIKSHTHRMGGGNFQKVSSTIKVQK